MKEFKTMGATAHLRWIGFGHLKENRARAGAGKHDGVFVHVI